MSETNTKLVTLSQLAAHLRLPAAELRLEVNAERLPAVRIGKRGLLFDLERVERLLSERAAVAPAPEARP